MNPQHLAAFVWLRQRLMLNQLRRAGIGNQIVLALIAASLILGAGGTLGGGVAVGGFVLPAAPPLGRLLAWDGLIVAFLFVRLISLLSDLQRTDGIAPAKYLHLPVSPAGAFVVNYVSALAAPTLLFLVAAVVGLTLGQTLAGSPLTLLTLSLLLAFVFAVTAVTDLVQSAIASLALTPRRKQALGIVVAFVIVGVVQVPNLLNLTGAFRGATKDLDRNLVEPVARVVNLVLPPGWFALGAAKLADGAALPALAGTLGLTLIGLVALRLSYRAAVRLAKGTDLGTSRAAPVAVAVKTTKPRLAEWRLPGVPEPAAAVAVSAFRAMSRSPEIRATMVGGGVMLVVFAVGVYASVDGLTRLPAEARPVLGFAAVGFMTALSSGLVGNLFGFDRAGFRAYVLSPASRRDMLLGKNLAVAPYAVVPPALALVALSVACPPRFDQFLAVLVALPAMFLIACLVGNVVSILFPMPYAIGATKPAQIKTLPMLASFGMTGLLPLAFTPLLLPIGVELLVAYLADLDVVPLALPLSALTLAGVALLYRAVLPVEGQLLARREQALLATVVSAVE